MQYQNINIKTSKGIIILTISREKALNALNDQTMEELKDFFTRVAPRRKKAKGIVITGAGEKSFVAGADIKEFVGMDESAAAALAKRGQDIFFLIEQFPKPVIAAVNGFALGGGCELAMACHMRIASEKARFGQPEVNLGIIPGYGGTQRLVQHIGKGKAIELMLTGDMIGAEEAHRLGLVNHVVPHGEAVKKAKEIIEKIATKAPIAVANVIKSVNAYFNGVYDGYAVEVEAFGHSANTEDFQEGASAFIERRTPDFKGQ